ncbi:cytochrome c oxidase subunit II, partial [Xanthomonas sp. Kuri4-1]
MKQRNGWNGGGRGFGALAAAWLAPPAWAQSADPREWQLNMGRGVTRTARMAYEAHMVALWVCVVIGVIVFGAI